MSCPPRFFETKPNQLSRNRTKKPGQKNRNERQAFGDPNGVVFVSGAFSLSPCSVVEGNATEALMRIDSATLGEETSANSQPVTHLEGDRF